MDRNLMNQYKNSAILMKMNGRFLISNTTKHMKTRHFFVKDKVDKGDIEIQYFLEVYPFP